MTDHTTSKALGLFGALLGVFSEVHPFADQWVQRDSDATCKGLHGDHLVYLDGKPVDKTPPRPGAQTMTASVLGWRSAARHVASYSAVQVATGVAVTRGLGYRVPAQAILAGAVINGVTHLVIDRREPLMKAAAIAGKTGYIEHCTVTRSPDSESAELTGPGTALMELDQALHRAIGIGAALVTTWLAIRAGKTTSTKGK